VPPAKNTLNSLFIKILFTILRPWPTSEFL
jgi:hypothetical protein